MPKLKLHGKDLRQLGYSGGKPISLAINLAKQHFKRSPRGEVLQQLATVLARPEDYINDPVWEPLAHELIKTAGENKPYTLKPETGEYRVYGEEDIEKGAREQMDAAMRLPVARGGALMADAHQGYGLPIGGVLAVENAVIPYGVGMDIGCRMCLSVYPFEKGLLEEGRDLLKGLLLEHTRFGQSAFEQPFDDEVLHRPEFKEIKTLKSLRQKAREQIGTSGSGNHFVEFGLVRLTGADNEWGLPPGEYVGLLSHSGSRGFGAKVAQHYTKVAMERCPLPREARHLAWLDLDSEAGQEYWRAMNLAGDYASANHHHIHRRISEALGEQPVGRIENHHNFAWKERLPDGREVIVHRKGATPAAKGVLGVIPGSMIAPGYLVRGRGAAPALHSASHGAGRRMSRKKAKAAITRTELEQQLRKQGVELIGGGLDEAPLAYKDINSVMNHQQELVDVLGTFLPKVVRMDAG